jgi:hypothetical protein
VQILTGGNSANKIGGNSANKTGGISTNKTGENYFDETQTGGIILIKHKQAELF